MRKHINDLFNENQLQRSHLKHACSTLSCDCIDSGSVRRCPKIGHIGTHSHISSGLVRVDLCGQRFVFGCVEGFTAHIHLLIHHKGLGGALSRVSGCTSHTATQWYPYFGVHLSLTVGLCSQQVLHHSSACLSATGVAGACPQAASHQRTLHAIPR